MDSELLLCLPAPRLRAMVQLVQLVQLLQLVVHVPVGGGTSAGRKVDDGNGVDGKERWAD